MMWALICTTAPVVCANEPIDSICQDSLEYSISPLLLNEIVVAASPIIRKTDRQVIRPHKDIVRSSSNGIDLLRKLQLSQITVNPITNEVVLAGGGSVVLCINGVESTLAQISTISPEDIVKIEFHDNPGVRYPGASAVIDYIIVHHDSGGNLMFDAFAALAPGRFASIDHFAGQYNCRRSVWNVNVGFMGQQKDKWVRDYEEMWHYPDVTVCRKEYGLPVKVGGSGLESLVNYNYINQRGDMFNMQLGFSFDDVPNMEQGDRHAILETSVSDNQVLVREHTEQYSIRPKVGLYYIHHFGDSENLIFDFNGSFLRSKMMHLYTENGIGDINRVNGYKYMMNALAMYEKRQGSRVWSVGVSNTGSVVHNIYRNEEHTYVYALQSQTCLSGEYSDRFGNFGTVLSLRVAQNHLRHDKGAINKFGILPSIKVSYRPAEKCLLRYSASLDYRMPGVSEVSAVEQSIQMGMIRRGNPDLRPFRVIDQSFITSFENSYASVDAWIEYRNENKPIMESEIFDNGEFVRTYYNQRSFQRLRTGASLSLRPWDNHVSIKVEPRFTRYFSHGIDYHHCHNIFRIGWSADFSYGNWLFYGNIMSGPENKMYGEEIIEERDMNQVMAGYKRNWWSVHLGVFNAFMRNYWMETRNLSSLTPYRSKAHSGRSSSYVAIKINISLDFGSRGRQFDALEEVTDIDSGILTGTK